MLNLVFNLDCPDLAKLNPGFWFPQTWQMNLARSMGSTQGIAALTAASLGLGPGTWNLVSPIFWQATHNDAMIVQVTAEQNSTYFTALQQFLIADGARLWQLQPDLWLMDAPFLGDLNSCDLNEVMHHSLQAFLQAMPPAWRRWWTEVQMLFQTLKTQDPCSINGVWPWGGGAWQPRQAIYCYPQELEFKHVHGCDWDLNNKPKNGTILIDQAQALRIYQAMAKTTNCRFWWRNGYWEQASPTIWQRLRGWIKHAN